MAANARVGEGSPASTAIYVLAALLVLGIGCLSEAAPEKSTLRQALENAGAAQERYADLHGEDHARHVAQLVNVGLRIPEGIELRMAAINNTRSNFAREYCIEGRDSEGRVAHFDNISKFNTGPCGSFWFKANDP